MHFQETDESIQQYFMWIFNRMFNVYFWDFLTTCIIYLLYRYMCIFCKEFLIFYPSFCLVQSGGQMPRNFRGFWSPKKFDNFRQIWSNFGVKKILSVCTTLVQSDLFRLKDNLEEIILICQKLGKLGMSRN